MNCDLNTPVLVGAGQSVDRIDATDYHAWSAADLAADAARKALDDAGIGAGLAPHVDAIAATRTFEDTLPDAALFGRPSNFPRAVAHRLGMTPKKAIWAKAGGNSPQDLVIEFCKRIAEGEFRFVLLAGGEAISTVRHAQRSGLPLDFAEEIEGEVEDRGPGLEDWRDPLASRHGVISPTLAYALAENARRARLRMGREDYAAVMGELFAPFAAVASANPHAAWACSDWNAHDLVTPGPENRWIADPYPLRLVARDQVNLGAALVLAQLGAALELGIPRERMVFLHGHASAVEKALLARPDLGDSPAARLACEHALESAGARLEEFAAFDFYSCFPVAVEVAAIDGLGLSAEDPRGLTLTGGLPFFGGPGNNYSMHAIAEAAHRARSLGGDPVLVGANGGYLSKYSVGIYSSEPRGWANRGEHTLQSGIDRAPGIVPLESFEGEAVVETYTVHHNRNGPRYAIAVARNSSGDRVIARSAEDDSDCAQLAHEEDLLNRPVAIVPDNGVNLFRL